jgi:DNA-binding IclR family transcriptional regulator
MTDLLHELNLVGAHGYAFSRGTVSFDSGTIAVEMPTPRGQPAMAIGIGSSNETLVAERDDLLALLRDTLQPPFGGSGKHLYIC